MTALRLSWTEEADRAVPLPSYETEGAAGADIRANFSGPDRVDGLTLGPGQQEAVPTGLRMEIPAGFEVQLRPRSGLALKKKLSMLNAPATIDSDYRGEVRVLLYNAGDAPIAIEHGSRIAQMVVAPVIQAAFALADDLAPSNRGSGGFGSTGTS
ncbi:MAG: dUTP diphosphatase [Pseudomonadota bacterium]